VNLQENSDTTVLKVKKSVTGIKVKKTMTQKVIQCSLEPQKKTEIITALQSGNNAKMQMAHMQSN
jgi:hypothetical protein